MINNLSINIDQYGVALISLNRPKKHNAFDDVLIEQLTQQLKTLDQDPKIRIVILTGSGESFSSGADLNWMKSMINYDQQTNLQDSLRLAELMQQLYALTKPTIARVNGPAYGGALGLIACCDIAIGVNNASFCFSEVKLGIAPAVISPYIVAAIGSRQAKKLFLSGGIFDAQEAVRIGLLHDCVSPLELDEAIYGQVKLLLKGGPNAQKEIKQLVDHFTNIPPDVNLKTTELIAKLRTSEEGQEGLDAFLNKRKAGWIKRND